MPTKSEMKITETTTTTTTTVMFGCVLDGGLSVLEAFAVVVFSLYIVNKLFSVIGEAINSVASYVLILCTLSIHH